MCCSVNTAHTLEETKNNTVPNITTVLLQWEIFCFCLWSYTKICDMSCVIHPDDLWPSHWLFPSSYCLLSQTQSAVSHGNGKASQWAELCPGSVKTGWVSNVDLAHTRTRRHTQRAWEPTLWAQFVLLNWKAVRPLFAHQATWTFLCSSQCQWKAQVPWYVTVYFYIICSNFISCAASFPILPCVSLYSLLALPNFFIPMLCWGLHRALVFCPPHSHALFYSTSFPSPSFLTIAPPHTLYLSFNHLLLHLPLTDWLLHMQTLQTCTFFKEILGWELQRSAE